MEEFDKDTFRDICLLNDIEPSNSDKCYKAIKKLKLFYTGISQLFAIQHFTNLRELVIIGQPIAELKQLNGCKHLQLLWICECEVQSMKHMDAFTNLKDLCLFDNKIERIQGLERLTSLKKLNLSDNFISNLSSLNHLVNLKDLNVAGNFIQRINSELSSNLNLAKINLSGNSLYNLSDILSLASLPCLKKLAICDPEYHPNPITSHPQTSAAILHYMPTITEFDNIPVDSPLLHNLFQTILCDKKQFYFAFYRHKLNEFQRTMFNLHALKKMFLRKIYASIKKIDCELRFMKSSNAMLFNIDQSTYDAKVDALELRIVCWKHHLALLHLEYENSLASNFARVSLRHCLIACELQLFGSLNIIEGIKSDTWFRRCEKFCLSHFCSHGPLFAKYSDFLVSNVFKICNKPLNTHFLQHNNNKDLSNDLLFFCKDLSSEFCCLANIVRDGFSTAKSNEPIFLSPSLNCALGEKTADTRNIQNKTYFRFIIVRALLHSLSNDSGEITTSDANFNFESCDCIHSKNPPMYKVCSPDDVYPEFIVELECTIPKNAHFHFADYLNCSSSCLIECDIFESNFGGDCAADQVTLDLPPKINPNTDIANTSSMFALQNPCVQQSSPSVTELNLHGTPVLSLPFFKRFLHLKSLTLSCCHLQDLSDLNGLELLTLDVSHNQLDNLSSITHLPELISLDVSWNKMVNLENEILHIQQNLKKLFNLKIEFNPWLRKSEINRRVLSIFPNLKFIDGCQVQKVPNKIRTPYENFKKAYLFSEKREFWLSLWPIYLFPCRGISTIVNSSCHSLMPFVNFFDNVPIHSAHLDRIAPQHLICLSLNNTQLSDISVLSSFINIEELSIENNSVSNLVGIKNLCNLKSLLAAGNFISNLNNCGLNDLKKLQILALDNNKLSRIDALTTCVSLKQLYLSSNRLNNFQSLQLLRNLNDLGVLDLRFNPIVKSLKNYRLRFVFHLPSLHILDGCNIQLNEISLAKEMLEGKLTVEYLSTEIGHNNFYRLVHFTHEFKGLRMVDLDPPKNFTRLRSINLEGNNLTSFSGLLYLETLEVLCLNDNKIECLFPKATLFDNFDINQLKSRKGPLLPNLKILSLANNGIVALQALQLFHFPSLSTLFLQGNKLISVDGLDGLRRLRDLVLDDNNIRKLTSSSFAFNCNLSELHLENNRLKDLPTLPHLTYLERIYLGGNKMEDVDNLISCFSSLRRIKHVSLVDNPLAKKLSHRWMLSYHLTDLISIDGVDVSDEEKQIVANLISDHQYSGYLDSKLNTAKPDWVDSTCNEIHSEGQIKTLEKSKPPKLFPVANVSVALIYNIETSPHDCFDSTTNKQNCSRPKKGKTGIIQDNDNIGFVNVFTDSDSLGNIMPNICQRKLFQKVSSIKSTKDDKLTESLFVTGSKASPTIKTNNKRFTRNNGVLKKRLALPGISIHAATDLFAHLPPLDFESTKSSSKASST